MKRIKHVLLKGPFICLGLFVASYFAIPAMHVLLDFCPHQHERVSETCLCEHGCEQAVSQAMSKGNEGIAKCSRHYDIHSRCSICHLSSLYNGVYSLSVDSGITCFLKTGEQLVFNSFHFGLESFSANRPRAPPAV